MEDQKEINKLKIVIADKEFILEPFSIDEGIEIEEELGDTVSNAVGDGSFKNIKKFVTAVIRVKYKDITPEWVGKNFKLADGEVFYQLVNFIFASSIQQKTKEKSSG